MNVVSSFLLINETRQEGGKYVNAHTITAIGADQHDYDPTPTDVKRTQDAAVVFANGLNLEKGGSGWFDKLMKTTDKHMVSTNVTDCIDNQVDLRLGVAGQDNPHAWNGILEGKTYAANIAKVLRRRIQSTRHTTQKPAAYEAVANFTRSGTLSSLPYLLMTKVGDARRCQWHTFLPATLVLPHLIWGN